MVQSAAHANALTPSVWSVSPLREDMQPPVDYDIAIVGGGIAGVTLAAALKDSGLTVVIIEAQQQSVAIAKGQAYAVHLSSKRIWESIGVWPRIEPQVQYFNQVRMSDADCRHVVRFKPSDLGVKFHSRISN